MRPNTKTNIATISAAIDQLGLTIDAQFIMTLSAQAIVTGSSTGTLNIQASNDPLDGLAVNSKGQPIPVTWTNIATVGTVTLSAAGNFLIPKFDVAYRWLRCSYVHNNGAAGTVTVNVTTQGAN